MDSTEAQDAPALRNLRERTMTTPDGQKPAGEYVSIDGEWVVMPDLYDGLGFVVYPARFQGERYKQGEGFVGYSYAAQTLAEVDDWMDA